MKRMWQNEAQFLLNIMCMLEGVSRYAPFTSKGKAIDINWTAGYEKPKFRLYRATEREISARGVNKFPYYPVLHLWSSFWAHWLNSSGDIKFNL